jgi:SAM-dependent methyltransferase
MADAITERVWRYMLDGGDDDLRRLLRISKLMADPARDALRRSGVGEGCSAIECGCGPIGALPELAELVGPTGRVTGVDLNPNAVARARTALTELRLENVDVLVADVNKLDDAGTQGPFDLAYSRCFLMHQPDPVGTLTQIARQLKPGGWIIAQEPLGMPPPQAAPPLECLAAYWQILHELLEHAGVPPLTAARLPVLALEAGLEVTHAGGVFNLIPPKQGLELHADTFEAIRERALAAEIVSPERFDERLRELRTAPAHSYTLVTSPFFIDIALYKPAEG